MVYIVYMFSHGSCRHGGAERVYRLEFVSNHDFMETEFDKWRETMMIGGFQLPTIGDIDQKVKDIKEALQYKYKEEDIDQVRLSFISCIHFRISC